MVGMTSPAPTPPVPDRANTAPIIVPRRASNHVLTSMDAPIVVHRPKIRPVRKPSTASTGTLGTNETAARVSAVQMPPATIEARTPKRR